MDRADRNKGSVINASRDIRNPEQAEKLSRQLSNRGLRLCCMAPISLSQSKLA